jgi:hypothetical protein
VGKSKRIFYELNAGNNQNSILKTSLDFAFLEPYQNYSIFQLNLKTIKNNDWGRRGPLGAIGANPRPSGAIMGPQGNFSPASIVSG